MAFKGRNFVYLCTCVACLSSILMGYDVGIMSGAIIYMERDLTLSTWDVEIIISSMQYFSIVGALFGGHIASIIGRRKTIAIAAVLFLLGTFVLAITTIFGVIVFGRVILGIASGLGLLIAPLYTAELSPPEERGKLVSLSEISINAGLLIGYFVAWIFYFFPLNDDQSWRLMISLGAIPSIVLLIAMIFMPESPRWLIEQNHIEEARKVLSKITYNSDDSNAMISNESQIAKKIKEIQESIELERSEMQSSWLEVLMPCVYKPPAALRKAILVGCGIAFFQQCSGIDAVVYYTPQTFRELGMGDQQILLFTTFVGLSKTLFIVVAMFLLDKVGRRPMLLVSSVLMTIALFGLTISFVIGRPPGFTIFLQCAFVGAFSLGWGPCCWVVISEIYPLQIRSKAMSVATSVNRLTSATVALTFLSIQKVFTPVGTWVMFTCFSLLGLLFVYKYVPETASKSLEQITQQLTHQAKRHSVPDSEDIHSDESRAFHVQMAERNN